jgi:hypothetical protein
MRNVQYLMDTHVLTAGEVAYTRCIKVWTPESRVPVIMNQELPRVNKRQLWNLFHAECSVVHANGYVVQGIKMVIIEVGPPGQGGLILNADWQGAGIPARYMGECPCYYGFGWAIYPAASLITGDVVIFRAKYEPVMGEVQ